MDFPDYYGKNWSAFWDCLNRDCDIDFVKITGCNTVSEKMLTHIEIMKDLLKKIAFIGKTAISRLIIK